jgi:hypothetical protein
VNILKSYFYFLSAGISGSTCSAGGRAEGVLKGRFPKLAQHLYNNNTQSPDTIIQHHLFSPTTSPPLLHIHLDSFFEKVNKFGYNFTVEITDGFEIFGFLSRDRYVTSTTHNPHSSALPIAHLSYFVKKTLFQTPAIFEI